MFLSRTTELLQGVTHALGILYESSTVFAVGLGCAVLGLLVLSVRLSRLAQEHLVMAREIGLLRLLLEEARAAPPPAGRGDAS